MSDLNGVAGAIPSPAHAFSLDFSLIATAGFIGTAFAFLFVDFMDTAGTLTSVANLTGKVNKDGEVEGIDRALLSDSVATSVGALAGTSNTTSYIESGAGIKEGGKTGLTAVTVAVLHKPCIFYFLLLGIEIRNLSNLESLRILCNICSYISMLNFMKDVQNLTKF